MNNMNNTKNKIKQNLKRIEKEIKVEQMKIISDVIS